MSEDEVAVLIGSFVVACAAWTPWYWRSASVTTLASTLADRWPLYAAPLGCVVILGVILRQFAANDVRDDARYLVLYLSMGAAWVGVAAACTPFFGLSARDDVVERRNRAAGSVIAGGLVAVTFCFAGGNIGDGPGWWVVVYCGLLSTGGLFGLWAGLEKLTGISELVTIDRDAAAAWRLASFLVAAGLVLGRAVAGDWQSVGATTRDFLSHAWPALVLWCAAVVADKLCRPSPQQPVAPLATCGVIPCLIFVGAAILWLWHAGIGV